MKNMLVILLTINGVILLTISLLTLRMFYLVKKVRELNNASYNNSLKAIANMKRIVVQTLLVSLSDDTASKRKLEKMLEEE